MRDALDVFETFLHAKSDLPALVKMAPIHYQFGPFILLTMAMAG